MVYWLQYCTFKFSRFSALGVAGWRSGRPGPCRGANNGTPVFLFRAPMPLSKFCSPVRSLFGPRCLGENFALVGVACWSLSLQRSPQQRRGKILFGPRCLQNQLLSACVRTTLKILANPKNDQLSKSFTFLCAHNSQNFAKSKNDEKSAKSQ